MKIFILEERIADISLLTIDRPSPDPAGKIQVISATKPQGGSAGATSAHRQANIRQTCAAYRATVFQEVQEDSCVMAVSLLLLLTSHLISRRRGRECQETWLLPLAPCDRSSPFSVSLRPLTKTEKQFLPWTLSALLMIVATVRLSLQDIREASLFCGGVPRWAICPFHRQTEILRC